MRCIVTGAGSARWLCVPMSRLPPSPRRRADMTILIILAIAAWLLICIGVIALARSAAHGDRDLRVDAIPRFRRSRPNRPSSRNPG
jgi:hypothetical protein